MKSWKTTGLIFLIHICFFLDMNKCEQTGAEELLSMLSDAELMSVKDTVTKSMISTDSVSREKRFSISYWITF